MKEEAGKISNPTTNNDHESLCGRKIVEGKIHEKLGHQLSHGVQAYDKMTAVVQHAGSVQEAPPSPQPVLKVPRVEAVAKVYSP